MGADPAVGGCAVGAVGVATVLLFFGTNVGVATIGVAAVVDKDGAAAGAAVGVVAGRGVAAVGADGIAASLLLLLLLVKVQESGQPESAMQEHGRGIDTSVSVKLTMSPGFIRDAERHSSPSWRQSKMLKKLTRQDPTVI